MPQKRPHERFLELSSDPVALHEVTAAGVDGPLVDANEAACRLLGYEREELLGLTFQDLAAPGEPPPSADEIGALLGGTPSTRTTHLRARDGRVLAVELRCAAVEDARGRTQILSVLRDLGALPPLDYLALLHMAPDAILATSEGHRIVFWSKGAEATYGWTQEEALGRVPRELLKTRDHLPQVHGSVGDTLEAQGAWEGEVTHTCKDGRDIRVASRWLVHRDAQGRPRGVLGINRDVTEQRRAREQLQRLQHLEGVSRLVAGLAHHFNNRLAVILSCAEGLQLAIPAGASEAGDMVADILSAGNAAKELLARLGQFARTGAENTEPVGLDEVVRSCERELRRSLPAGVELALDLEALLWPVVCEPIGVERARSTWRTTRWRRWPAAAGSPSPPPTSRSTRAWCAPIRSSGPGRTSASRSRTPGSA